MLDYKGVNCPVCGKPLRGEDDVVVCPDCGAPYHRACYAQAGACVFPALHERGEEWRPPAPAAQEQPEDHARGNDLECPVCGLLNANGSLFCSRCGARLPTQADAGPVFIPRESGNAAFPGVPFVFDPLGGVSPTDEAAPGVSYGDLSKLVRQNTVYYLPVFRMAKQTGRSRFNFSAFLFSGGWLLYRKQYKLGAVVTGVMLALLAAFQLSYWLVSYPALVSLITDVGLDPQQIALFTNQDYLTLSAAAAEAPGVLGAMMLPFLFLLVMLVGMVVLGVKGNRLYLEHCLQTARRIRREESGSDEAYQRLGGVSYTLGMAVALAYLFLRTVLPALLR